MGEQERGSTKTCSIVARAGQEAVDILQGRRNRTPKPGLMLLDISLPKVRSHDVPNEIRADNSYEA